MFEGYLSAQTTDPRAQARLFLAACVASILATGGLAGAWTASKMSIEAVTPPRIDDPLMLPNVFAPPPPAPPPPRPSIDEPPPARSSVAAPTTNALAPLDSDVDPFADTTRPPIVAGPPGDGPPSTHRDFGPRCAMPPCIGNDKLVDPGIGDRGPPGDRQVARAPLTALRAQALYSPDPDRDELFRVRTGSGTHHGTTTVAFCVDEGGRIVDVRTARRFAGQPGVDALCRATVERWRFRPMLVAGRPTKTCSEVTFDISFE